jgi:hypothetical protein
MDDHCVVQFVDIEKLRLSYGDGGRGEKKCNDLKNMLKGTKIEPNFIVF